MIYNDDIVNNIEKIKGSSLYPDYDIRYLEKWMKEYPTCFPKFMLEYRYEAVFNWETLKWEIYEINK